MNIALLLNEQCQRRGNVPAIIETRNGRDQVLTYRQLDERTAQAAGMLRTAGLEPGDRVLVFHPMSIDLYVVLLALFRTGLVATFLDPSAGRKHIQRCCEIAQPKAFIASSPAHLLRLLVPSVRCIRPAYSIGWSLPLTRRWESLSQHAPDSTIIDRTDAEPALLTFTSGSTGQPKAVVRSHGLLLAQHAALEEAIELKPGQVDLSTLPIFTLANLASGLTTLIPDANLLRPGSVKPEPILRQIRQHRPDRVVASPAFLQVLADHCEARGLSLDSFTRLYTGGAPVFPRALEKFQRVAPNAQVIAVYGSTEAEPIAHMSWAEMSRDDKAQMQSGLGLLTGPIVPQIDLRIVPNQWGVKLGPYSSDRFSELCLPPDAPGEIVVHGRHVVKGYLHGVGDEQTKFAVEQEIWHRTGDAGYLDHAGRLWLLGRAEALIRDERGELYPFSVECAAMQLASVRRAALVSHQGLRVLAVEADPRAPSAATLEPQIMQELAWAALDRVLILPAIPLDKRHNAKVEYPTLRAMIQQRL